ncbi:MAG: heme ABC exporter ATP-binding protein CcmA [Rhodothalassiaceae bacterium]
MQDLPDLAVDALACRRGGRLLFKQISFTLAAGERIWVRGPNGTGKSSLLRVLAGLLPPASGHIRLDDADVLAERRWWAEQLHYVGHLNAAKPALTGRQQLGLFARAWNVSVAEQDAALARLGLAVAADRPIRTFSAGQQRRLALARLLLAPRPIWLLDEPATALDAAGASLVDALLDEHLALGGRALVVSHTPLAGATSQLGLGS